MTSEGVRMTGPDALQRAALHQATARTPPLQQDGIVDRGGVLVKVINRQALIIARPLIEGLITGAGGIVRPGRGLDLREQA
jgi:hypothetical protein